MSTAAFLMGAALWLLVLISLGMVYMRRQERMKAMAEAKQEQAAAASTASDDTQEASQEKPDDAVTASTKTVRINFPTRPLPDFEFPECMGGTVSKENMKGKRWVANFVFTRCAGPCPMMTRDMSLLHKRVARTAPDFQFVTFSVDSSYDNAEVLKKYADTFQADHARWKFVTGDEDQIHDFIRRGFALYVKANVGDMRKPGFEVAHSNRAVLVNEDGTPVASFLMNVPEDVVKLRRIIEGTDEFPKPGPLLTIEPSGENPDVGLTIVPAESTPEGKSDDGSKPTDEPKGEITPPARPDAASGDNSSAEATDSSDSKTGEGSKNESEPNASTNSTQSVFKALSLVALSPLQPTRNAFLANVVTSYQEAEQSETDDATSQKQTIANTEEKGLERNKEIDQKLPSWLAMLPTINAGLNTLSTLLLLTGYSAIRSGRRDLHRNLMIVAFCVSVVFLACYLTYHEGLFRYTGQRGRAFTGPPTAKMIYFAILWPHIILAVFVPILAIRVFLHAFKQRWPEHRKLAKITFPIWLFVSITGVIIYAMLYHYPNS